MQSTTATVFMLAAMGCVLAYEEDEFGQDTWLKEGWSGINVKHEVAIEDWQSHIKVVPIEKGDELVLKPVIPFDVFNTTRAYGYEWAYCFAINDCFATILKLCQLYEHYHMSQFHCWPSDLRQEMDGRWISYDISVPGSRNKPWKIPGLRVAAVNETHTSILLNIATFLQKQDTWIHKGVPKAYTFPYQINVLEMNNPIPQSMEITDMLGNPLSMVNGVINVREKDQLMIVCKGSKITCPITCPMKTVQWPSDTCYRCWWDSSPEFQVSIHIGELRLSYDNWKFSLEEEYPTCEQTIEVEKSHQGNVLFCETNTGAGIGWRKITNSVTLNVADLPSTTTTTTRPTTTTTTKTIPSSPETTTTTAKPAAAEGQGGEKEKNDIIVAVIIGVAGLVGVGVIIAVMYVRGKKKAKDVELVDLPDGETASHSPRRHSPRRHSPQRK